MFIIRNIPEQKYFVDIKHVTVTPDSVTELAHSMLKSFTPQTGITIEEENFIYQWRILYISGYLCRKVSRSACDQFKVILMPLINCIHFCLRSNILIFKVLLFDVKT